MTLRACCRRSRALLSCALAALCLFGCGRGANNNTPNKHSEGPREIVALGRLEPASGVLQIGAIPGDVLKGFPKGLVEGSMVDAGSELAWLESFDIRSTQLDAINAKLDLGRQQREQELAVAKANYEQSLAAKAEVDAKLEQLNAQEQTLEGLEEASRIAEKDYQALVDLQRKDPELVTEIQLRRKRNQAERATSEFDVQRRSHIAALKAAKAAVTSAEAGVTLGKLNLELAQKVDKNKVTEIEKKVAEETLQQSVLRAPISVDGGSKKFKVLKIFVKPGEFITQLPVMQIGDVSHMKCIAEVYESDVKEIAVDQKVSIHSAALAGDFADGQSNEKGGLPGKVTRIGSLVSSAVLMQRNPLAPSDRSIVEVEIEIVGENADATAKAIEEAAKHIGMQVTVTFLNDGAAKPASKPVSEAPSAESK